jgi:hypothetical protein
MVVTEERKDVMARVRKPKEKTYSTEGAKASRADWAERGSSARRGGAIQRGQTWVVRARPQEEFKWNLIFELHLNLDFGKI